MDDMDKTLVGRLHFALTGEFGTDAEVTQTAQEIMLATMVLSRVSAAVIESIPNVGPGMFHAEGLAIAITSLLYVLKETSRPELDIRETAYRLMNMALLVAEDTQAKLAAEAANGNKEVS